MFLTICVINFCTGVQSFGETCNRRKECNEDLHCLKGKCQCQNPDGQVFSEKLGICAVKIGRRCGTDEHELEENNNTTDVHENSTKKEDLICVENAMCKKIKLRKWCRCKEGFTPNSGGSKCSPVALYGDNCSLNEPCEKRSGTECIHGQCICPFGNDHQFFDNQEKLCVSYASKNCSIPKVSHCVKNAECSAVQLRTGYTTDDGVKKIHSKSLTHECHCVKGFAETKEGFCMGMYGTHCGLNQLCNKESRLVCSDGKV